MTVEQIDEALHRIAAMDDAQAHEAEDLLRHRVLLSIVNGAENPKELAAAVLKSSDIEFSRWYA